MLHIRSLYLSFSFSNPYFSLPLLSLFPSFLYPIPVVFLSFSYSCLPLMSPFLSLSHSCLSSSLSVVLSLPLSFYLSLSHYASLSIFLSPPPMSHFFYILLSFSLSLSLSLSLSFSLSRAHKIIL